MEGETLDTDQMIVLDINLKNKIGHPFKMEDMLKPTAVTDDLDMAGFQMKLNLLIGLMKWMENLNQEKKKDGQYVTDVVMSNEHS